MAGAAASAAAVPSRALGSLTRSKTCCVLFCLVRGRDGCCTSSDARRFVANRFLQFVGVGVPPWDTELHPGPATAFMAGRL